MGFLLLMTFFLKSQSINLEFDHLVINTNNLKKVAEELENLHGFDLKRKPVHKNGLENVLIEFPDNYEIEFISSTGPNDELSAFYYNRQIKHKEGSASFVSLRIKSFEDFHTLKRILKNESYGYKLFKTKLSNIISLAEPYDGLFFILYMKKNAYQSTFVSHKNKTNRILKVDLNKKFYNLFKILQNYSTISLDKSEVYLLSQVKISFSNMSGEFPFNKVYFNRNSSVKPFKYCGIEFKNEKPD